jgi:hypothetical protein
VIAFEVLTELRDRGVELTVVDGELRYRAPRGVLTPELRDALARHKAELLALLAPKAETANPLDPADCLVLIHVTFAAVAAEYVEGALALIEADPELTWRAERAEAAIVAAVQAGPTERELRSALATYVAVIREACARLQAQRDAGRPDPMPELPADAVAAVGLSYDDGEPGAWETIRRERQR